MVAPLADQPLAADSGALKRAMRAPAGQSEKTPITSLPGQGRAQVMQAISQATARLAESGVASAHSDARKLAEFVLGEKLYLLSQVPQDFFDRYEQMITRRAGREPLQLITGRMYFRYLELLSQPGVFIVRPETEVVAGAAIEAASALSAPLVVDLCTGSGAIACALASEVPGCRVWAVELDSQAAALARVNAQKNQANVNVIEADATGPLTELAEIEGQVDVVVTNPPYVPAGLIEDSETASYDPPLALFGGGVDGLELPLKLIKRASSLLRVGGVLVMEHDPSQVDALVKAAKAAGFSQSGCHRDLTGRQRYLQAVK